MAIIDLGKIKPINRGAWSGATTYAVDDFVLYGKHTFISKVDSNLNNTPYDQDTSTLDSTNWNFLAKGSEIDHKGEWDVATTYTLNDVVRQKESSFICINAPALAQDPFDDATQTLNATYWAFFANGNRIVHQGAWDSATPYILNDLVTHGKHTFMCALAHTGQDPYDENTSTLNSTYWSFFAQGTAPADWNATSGDSEVINKPNTIDSKYEAVKFAEPASGYISYRDGNVLMKNGQIRSWGNNTEGQLGDGTTLGTRNMASMVGVPAKVVKYWKSKNCGFALDEDHVLWGWGYNGYGAFGHNNTTQYPFPIPIPLPSGCDRFIMGVSADEHSHRNSHALYICRDTATGKNKVYSCGYNGYGQLGINNTTQMYTLQHVSALDNKDVVQVMAAHGNYGQSMALCANGDAYVWGWNGYGECGVGHQSNNSTTYYPRKINGSGGLNTSIGPVKQIWCWGHGSYGHTAVVTTEADGGKLWLSGYNGHGCFGVGDSSQRHSFTLSGSAGASNVKQFSATGSSSTWSVILKYDGYVHTVGYNGNGQLGIGNTTTQYSWQQPRATSSEGPYSPKTFPCNDGKAVAVFTSQSQEGSGSAGWIQDTGNWSVDGVNNLTTYPITYGDPNYGGGRAWIMGYNGNSGNLGIGHSTNNSTWNGHWDTRYPNKLCGPENVVDMRMYGSSSEHHTMVITTDGQILTGGWGSSGGLGRDNDAEHIMCMGNVLL